MLGSLVHWLRAIGYDTLYYKDTTDREIVDRALQDDRTIISRDHHFTRYKAVRYPVFIHSTILEEQFKQVVDEMHFDTKTLLFSRCVECNTLVEPVPKAPLEGRVPRFVYLTKEQFSQCTGCGRIYWAGTHLSEMHQKIQQMLYPGSRTHRND
jgi:uncharacterized protein with PIN domain